MASSSSSSRLSQKMKVKRTPKMHPYRRLRSNSKVYTTLSDVSPRARHSDFMCPICLELIYNTLITVECSHRFCSECICTALRAGNKECPICRTKLFSPRSLVHDPNYDTIIRQLYPIRSEFDALLEKEMQTYNNPFPQKAVVDPVMPSTSSQAQNVPRPNYEDEDEDEDSDDSSRSSSPEPESEPEPGPSSSASPMAIYFPPDDEVNAPRTLDGEIARNLQIVVNPHPILMARNEYRKYFKQTTRYIKISEAAEVRHLQLYFMVRAPVENQECRSLPFYDSAALGPINFSIHIQPSPGNFMCLPSDYSYQEIMESIWHYNKPLELYYVMEKP